MQNGYQKQIKLFFSYILFFFKILFILILSLFFLYHLAYSNRTLPGLYLGKISFSGLTKSQVEEKLKNVNKLIKTTWELEIAGRVYFINSEDIGYELDQKAVINELFLIGREKNLLISFRSKLISLTSGYHLNPIYVIDHEKYNKFLLNINESTTFAYSDAKYILDENNKLVIIPDQSGLSVSEKKIGELIYSKYYRFITDSKITLEPIIIPAKVTSKNLTSMFEVVSGFVDRDFKIEYNGQIWVPSAEEKLEMLNVLEKLSINSEQALLKQITESINKPKKVEEFEFVDGKVAKFVPANDGIQVDQEIFAQLLISSVIDKSSLVVQVPVKISSVKKGANEYGIKELIGSGETTYLHSAVNRVFNVNLAATRVTGVLVAPDETFSFVDTVGEVSASTGYKQGYIIYNNKTILGDGGGLCQVSTTLFRAILDAGLPVVSRIGHAYRVSYYEQNSDPGFDATVFVPSVDLKFKNDTGNYLLIISESKPDEYYLKYSIYGTDDGRKVTITKPVITSVTPPPDSVYQDDPSLPKGTTKQIEWATWGAKVQFSRTVEKGGKILSQDLFKTNYSPWANAYLVGTKE